MSYSNFTFENLEYNLKLIINETDLFSFIQPIEISVVFAEILQENVPLGLSIGTKKAKSELIIAPMLVELRKF
jgi:hypothetical protein